MSKQTDHNIIETCKLYVFVSLEGKGVSYHDNFAVNYNKRNINCNILYVNDGSRYIEMERCYFIFHWIIVDIVEKASFLMEVVEIAYPEHQKCQCYTAYLQCAIMENHFKNMK